MEEINGRLIEIRKGKEMKTNKYINYASFDFDSMDIGSISEVIQNVLNNKISVSFPLSVHFARRSFSIKNRGELIIFMNAVNCTTEKVSSEYEDSFEDDDYNNDDEYDCNDLDSEERHFTENKYGVVEHDIFYLG